MGLFDMFKSKGDEMTPHKAFTIALLYMMSADGEIDNEEVGHLLSVLGGQKEQGGTIGVGGQQRELLNSAIAYRRQHRLEDFLEEVSPMLSDAQKMCILVNLVDSSLADGEAEPEEQQMFDQFLRAFGISEARFRPFFEVVVLKNDRSVFTDPNDPKNRPDFQVKLSL